MTEPTKAAIYLRVSTDDQDEENQEPACMQMCLSRGWAPVVYRERITAVATRRPQWERLREDVRRGAVRAVVFYSISRIGRKRTAIAQELADLARWGASIVSVREKFLDVDNSPELGRVREMLIQWFAWFAEAERDDLVDRTNRALERVRAELARNGQHTSKAGRTIWKLGRPGYGEKWKRRALELAATLEVPEGRSRARAVAEQMHAEGGPKIAQPTVFDWLRKRTYPKKEAPRAGAAN